MDVLDFGYGLVRVASSFRPYNVIGTGFSTLHPSIQHEEASSDEDSAQSQPKRRKCSFPKYAAVSITRCTLSDVVKESFSRECVINLSLSEVYGDMNSLEWVLKDMPFLSHVNLSYNHVGGALSSVPSLCRVKNLNLHHCGLMHQDIQTLTGMSPPFRWTSLNVSHNSLPLTAMFMLGDYVRCHQRVECIYLPNDPLSQLVFLAAYQPADSGPLQRRLRLNISGSTLWADVTDVLRTPKKVNLLLQEVIDHKIVALLFFVLIRLDFGIVERPKMKSLLSLLSCTDVTNALVSSRYSAAARSVNASVDLNNETNHSNFVAYLRILCSFRWLESISLRLQTDTLQDDVLVGLINFVQSCSSLRHLEILIDSPSATRSLLYVSNLHLQSLGSYIRLSSSLQSFALRVSPMFSNGAQVVVVLVTPVLVSNVWNRRTVESGSSLQVLVLDCGLDFTQLQHDQPVARFMELVLHASLRHEHGLRSLTVPDSPLPDKKIVRHFVRNPVTPSLVNPDFIIRFASRLQTVTVPAGEILNSSQVFHLPLILQSSALIVLSYLLTLRAAPIAFSEHMPRELVKHLVSHSIACEVRMWTAHLKSSEDFVYLIGKTLRPQVNRLIVRQDQYKKRSPKQILADVRVACGFDPVDWMPYVNRHLDTFVSQIGKDKASKYAVLAGRPLTARQKYGFISCSLHRQSACNKLAHQPSLVRKILSYALDFSSPMTVWI
eukprot:GILJ01012818.1.p1 GENE.GILJ01012818.1~~GILJ01012818.1.p1  ORF type:complete len:719 (-),score=56.89 GILJ01012818.1:84-2240(-)